MLMLGIVALVSCNSSSWWWHELKQVSTFPVSKFITRSIFIALSPHWFSLLFMQERFGPVQKGRLAESLTQELRAAQFKKKGLQLQFARISSTIAA